MPETNRPLLLDSNVVVWWLRAEPTLVRDGHYQRINTTPRVAVSTVSAWELWIKEASGKLVLGPDLDARLREGGFDLLAPDIDDARLAARLPPVHKDPFDRMIVAQALNRRLPIMTSDALLARYGVDLILVDVPSPSPS